jgi:peptidoglycan/xylan/chitin deacetylase (PgdA/CDA1 family)
MAQRGIGRSAVTVGLLVLTVLIGGRMVGSWHHRQVTHLATGTGTGQPAGAHAADRPARSTARPASPTPTGPTGATGRAAPAANASRPSPPATTPGRARTSPPAARPPARHPDPTFGAKRTTGSSTVALTFDDGPDPTWTPQVLDLLRQHGVKATFCVVGVHASAHPRLVARIVREGHTLCNHSWQHDMALGQKPADQIKADLSRTSAAIRKAVPKARIPYYRQPGGLWTAEIVSVAKRLGMTPLGWTVDPADWTKPGEPAIVNRVMQHTSAGSIVLLHDGGGDRSQTLAACRTLIPSLKQRFRLVALR